MSLSRRTKGPTRLLKTGEIVLSQEEPKPEIYIMSNDPSMTAWGWSIIDRYGTMIDSGAIQTRPIDKKLRVRKGDDNIRRITEINNALILVIGEYKPSLILSELPHGSQSAVSATMLAFATATMQTISTLTGIPIEWYSEGDAKLAVSGKRAIEKNAMVALMAKKNPTMQVRGIKWIDQAVADSLAVYYAAVNQSNLLKLLNK